MAEIGLAEAAQLTGRNRTTLHRAMKTGRLSYTINDAGQRRIEVAELQRVFGPINDATPEVAPAAVQSHSAQRGELAALQRLLDDREATIAELRATIRDQREDLREVGEERRRLMALLTGPRRPWWRRWFR